MAARRTIVVAEEIVPHEVISSDEPCAGRQRW